jgi:hypothetical protein
MKYSENQFRILVKCIKILNQYVNVKNINPNALHFKIYQQFSEGQKHNQLVINSNNEIVRKYVLDNNILLEKEGKKLFDFDFDFELYPNNCNDKNIETAVNKAIKLI